MISVTPICPLFFGGCPATITGLIISVWVWVSVKTCSFTAWPHIAEKYRKIVAPLFTHSDPFGPIQVPTIVSRVITALFCGTPRGIFRTVVLAMLDNSGSKQSASIASATFTLASNQTIRQHDATVPAFAHAKPLALVPTVIISTFNNAPRSKSFSCQVNKIMNRHSAKDFTIN